MIWYVRWNKLTTSQLNIGLCHSEPNKNYTFCSESYAPWRLILFIQTLVLYKSFACLLTYFLNTSTCCTVGLPVVPTQPAPLINVLQRVCNTAYLTVYMYILRLTRTRAVCISCQYVKYDKRELPTSHEQPNQTPDGRRTFPPGTYHIPFEYVQGGMSYTRASNALQPRVWAWLIAVSDWLPVAAT